MAVLSVHNEFDAIAGEDLLAADAVCLHTDGELYKANAITGGAQQIPCHGFAEVAVDDGEMVKVVCEGVVQGVVAQGFTGLTIGEVVFLAETDGDITQTAPTTGGDLVQRLGTAISALKILVNIQPRAATGDTI